MSSKRSLALRRQTKGLWAFIIFFSRPSYPPSFVALTKFVVVRGPGCIIFYVHVLFPFSFSLSLHFSLIHASPNIVLGTYFSNILNLRHYFTVRNQVLHPNRIRDKNCFRSEKHELILRHIIPNLSH
jgi:hypothetical protein